MGQGGASCADAQLRVRFFILSRPPPQSTRFLRKPQRKRLHRACAAIRAVFHANSSDRHYPSWPCWHYGTGSVELQERSRIHKPEGSPMTWPSAEEILRRAEKLEEKAAHPKCPDSPSWLRWIASRMKQNANRRMAARMRKAESRRKARRKDQH